MPVRRSFLHWTLPSIVKGLAVALFFLHCLGVRAQTSGRVDTIGGAFAGYADGNNNVSQFNLPMGLALDGAGNLLIADFGNNAVRSMRLSDATVTTLFSANGPVAVAATTNSIYVLNRSGGFISSYDRFGNRRENLLNGLNSPTAINVDTNGNVYVTEGGGVVRRISPTGAVTGFYRVPEGFPDLRGVAIFPDGKVAVSDGNTKVIWLFNGPSQQPTVLAGTKYGDGFADGPPGIALFRYPEHLAVGPNNSLVVADRFNHRVRVVSCEGVVTTLYGMDPSRWEQSPDPNFPIFPGWYDGGVDFAESRDPLGVAVGGDGTVYGSELYYHLVRAGSGFTFPASCGGQTNTGSTNIVVPIPVLTPNSGFFPDGVTVSITASNSPAGFGPNTRLHYTLDGTEPTTNSPSINIINGVGRLTLPGPIDLAALKVRAFIGTSTSVVVSAQPTVVPVPVLSPNAGYYPMGVRIVVTSTNGFPNGTQLYYTFNGSEPTTNSFFAPIQNGQAIIVLRGAQADLRSLRVKAFLGPNAGLTTSGQAVSFPLPTLVGEVGIPPGLNSGNLFAGEGAIIVVPVVANLRAGQSLRSLQFVAELVSLGQAPPPGGANRLRVLNLSSNDFIQVAAASFGTPQVLSTVIGTTNRMAVAYIGADTPFSVVNFATVAMLGVPISPLAREGDRYRLSIREVSGTSDGVEQSVPLRSMPDREIVVQNISYLIGDTAPAYWYNAGDFGDGVLNNADVNNVFYAAFGFRVPYEFGDRVSDVFNAMDAYPPPGAGTAGGDGAIRYIDAQVVLARSLGFDPENWARRHEGDSPEGYVAFPTSSNGSFFTPAETLSANSVLLSGTWKKHASISAGVVQGIPQTSPVSIPVKVKAYGSNRISGMQFVAKVRSASGAAPVSQVRFVPNSGIPNPNFTGNSVPGLGVLNDSVYCSWNLDSFNPPLQGEVQIGTIEFQVPSNAQSLLAYEVTFSHADGASTVGGLVQYDFESFRGAAWVNTFALATQDQVSDEWKAAYFGSPTALDGRGELDADQDGYSNLQEFQSGLNPLNKDWRMTFLRGRFTFRFVREEDKKYRVQKSLDLRDWSDVSETYSGPAGLQDFIEASTTGKVNHFYRVVQVP